MEADSTKINLLFTINGMNVVLGWNAVLAALDYFQASFPDFKVYAILPVPVFVGYMIIGINYHSLSNKFKHITLLTFGSIGINIGLACILLVSLLLKNTALGFGLLLCCALGIGMSSNTFQLTILSMVNYLSRSVVSKYTIGTALSGLSVNILRVIILSVAGANNKSVLPIVIYFASAMAFNLADLFLNVRFIKSEIYHQKIGRHVAYLYQNNTILTSSSSASDIQSPSKVNVEVRTDISSTYNSLLKGNQKVQEQKYYRTFLAVIKAIFPYPLVLVVTLGVTYILFPGPSFSKTLPTIQNSWSVMLMLLYFNVGDSIGKAFAGFEGVFNKYSLYFLFITRVVFALPITVMANGSDLDDPLLNNYYFPFINQFLFGFTNGICINASFIMAFKVCPPNFKKYAGVFCGLSLQFGIILGVILDIPYSYLIGIN